MICKSSLLNLERNLWLRPLHIIGHPFSISWSIWQLGYFSPITSKVLWLLNHKGRSTSSIHIFRYPSAPRPYCKFIGLLGLSANDLWGLVPLASGVPSTVNKASDGHPKVLLDKTTTGGSNHKSILREPPKSGIWWIHLLGHVPWSLSSFLISRQLVSNQCLSVHVPLSHNKGQSAIKYLWENYRPSLLALLMVIRVSQLSSNPPRTE